jgi:hypothetical protein
MLVNALPETNAPKDKATLAMMLEKQNAGDYYLGKCRFQVQTMTCSLMSRRNL